MTDYSRTPERKAADLERRAQRRSKYAAHIAQAPRLHRAALPILTGRP